MEGTSGAARSAGSPSPTEPPASDQTALEKMPVLPSGPAPVSGPPWVLGRPSAGALSSITVPIRLDALSYLLNSALLGAYTALPQAPLYGSHGRPSQHAMGCRCQAHPCCAMLPACTNLQQAQGRCCGASAVGQSSAACSQELSVVRRDWPGSSPRQDHRGSPALRGWGEYRQKDSGRPWAGQRPWGKADSAPWRAGQWGSSSRIASGSDYAARKRYQEGRPWDVPGAKRWSSRCPERERSAAGETEAAKATGEDWEADSRTSAAPGRMVEKAGSSQAALLAAQDGEDWEKEYEEAPKSAPGLPPPGAGPSKVQQVSSREQTTSPPASEAGAFSSYLQNLFCDLPGGPSAVPLPGQESEPQGGAADSRPPAPGGGPYGCGSAGPSKVAAQRADPS